MAPIVTSLASIVKQFGIGGLVAGGVAPSGITATGGVISDYTDGGTTYRAHIFTSTGTFAVSALGTFGDTVEYLVVAGGGGGSGTNGIAGGAGAGGLRTNVPGVVNASSSPLTISTPFPVSSSGGNGAGGYTVTVGGGGAGGPNWPAPSTVIYGIKGNPSYFGPPSTPNGITATGGGQGRCNNSSPYAGYPGGSGGGGTGNDPGTSPGSGNEGGNIDGKPEGNPGGTGGPSGNYGSGGGGGAGAPGGNATPGTGGAGGAGGAGVQVLIAGPPTYSGVGALNPGPGEYQWFAGGGGGSGYPSGGGDGAGGVGGGGAAARHPSWNQSYGQSGVVGTGGGGGAGPAPGAPTPPNYGGSGGSGIVVVRYQIAQLTATAKATGGAISFYSGKTIHTFTSSGSFATAPNWSPTSVEYVVIGGGGGGGAYYAGGGGGAGQFITNTNHPIGSHPVSVTVQVGAGGQGVGPDGTPGLPRGGAGTTSYFGTPLTAGGGGGGGSAGSSSPGVTGGPGQSGTTGTGSGGGAGYWNGGGGPHAGGTSTGPGSNPGGTGTWTSGSNHTGGGGGGAGSSGGNAGSPSGYAGPGGDGIRIPSTFHNPISASPPSPWTGSGDQVTGGLGTPGPLGSFYVAGGGGGAAGPGPGSLTGGTGGYGGGGRGGFNPATSRSPQSGVQNTGSGGGGSGNGAAPGSAGSSAGGSGIVIIAYPS